MNFKMIMVYLFMSASLFVVILLPTDSFSTVPSPPFSLKTFLSKSSHDTGYIDALVNYDVAKIRTSYEITDFSMLEFRGELMVGDGIKIEGPAEFRSLLDPSSSSIKFSISVRVEEEGVFGVAASGSLYYQGRNLVTSPTLCWMGLALEKGVLRPATSAEHHRYREMKRFRTPPVAR